MLRLSLSAFRPRRFLAQPESCISHFFAIENSIGDIGDVVRPRSGQRAPWPPDVAPNRRVFLQRQMTKMPLAEDNDGVKAVPPIDPMSLAEETELRSDESDCEGRRSLASCPSLHHFCGPRISGAGGAQHASGQGCSDVSPAGLVRMQNVSRSHGIGNGFGRRFDGGSRDRFAFDWLRRAPTRRSRFVKLIPLVGG